jgi:hypothetical protein
VIANSFDADDSLAALRVQSPHRSRLILLGSEDLARSAIEPG